MSNLSITRADGSGLVEPVVPSTRRVTQSSTVARRNPLSLAGNVAAASIDSVNQLLADAITLRDLYKKHHWQASAKGHPTNLPGGLPESRPKAGFA